MARDLSFPRAKRLTLSAEFDRVRKEGEVFHGKLLSIGVLRNADPFRAGFVISRALGGAVMRNRVRRRLREIVRKHQGEISDGVWIVTIARASAAAADFEQLEVEWLRLAKRASILSA